MVNPHSRFWLPVKIGLAVLAVILVAGWLFSPGEVYEPPIDGQYNSPANETYERSYMEEQEEPYDGGKSVGEELGEQTGHAWNGLKEGSKDFWKGLQSTVE